MALSRCNLACSGNSAELCGGAQTISVYYTQISKYLNRFKFLSHESNLARYLAKSYLEARICKILQAPTRWLVGKIERDALISPCKIKQDKCLAR